MTTTAIADREDATTPRPDLDRRFIWTAVRDRRSGGTEEAYEALQWLGRRLAFEHWFQDLRDADARRDARPASA